MPLLSRILPKELKKTINTSRLQVFLLSFDLTSVPPPRRVIRVAALFARISSVRRGAGGNRRLRDRGAAGRAGPTGHCGRYATRPADGNSKNRKTGLRRPSFPRAEGLDIRCA